MKNFKHILLALTLIVTLSSVGFGKDSPPKKATFEHVIKASSLNLAVNPIQMEAIAISVISKVVDAKAGPALIYAEEKIERPNDVFNSIKLSKYLNDPNISIKSIETRCRSSDLFLFS